MASCIQRRDEAAGGIYRLDDGESGCDVEGSIRLQGMLGRDCKSSSLILLTMQSYSSPSHKTEGEIICLHLNISYQKQLN